MNPIRPTNSDWIVAAIVRVLANVALFSSAMLGLWVAAMWVIGHFATACH